jgi:membrane-bound ClpP family serine protease
LKTSDQQHPRIKDGVGFQRGGKENTKIKVNEHGFPKFVKEKVKAPIVHNVHFPMLMPMSLMLMIRMLILQILMLCFVELHMLGILFLMLKLLMCHMLNLAMHQMVHTCHITHLMHLMCFHAKMARLFGP